MTTIGQRIDVAMRAAELDQPALAKLVGVSKQAVNAMITGKTKSPKPQHIFMIADITGFEARWIATGKGPRTRSDAALERLDISMLSPASQAAIRAALRAFAEQEAAPDDKGNNGRRHG